MTLRIFAPAKVNLHLAVGRLRDDGYHDVDTVLHTLAFGDAITISAARAFGFSCAPDLGLAAADNLAARAAHAMSERYERPLEVAIAVEKRVPAGAGLGGASTDAAGVICGLAHLWDIRSDDPGLSEVARSLGADVPFFLEGGAALFTGRGDVLERSLTPLDAPIVLVKPPEAVPTSLAYSAFDRLGAPEAPPLARIVEALESGNSGRVSGSLFNAMTDASVGLVPAIAGVMRLVGESHGVLGSAMAGSGSAVFGICSDAAAAEACAATARAAGLWAVSTRTHPGGCASERF